jgi:hypothetical protein
MEIQNLLENLITKARTAGEAYSNDQWEGRESTRAHAFDMDDELDKAEKLLVAQIQKITEQRNDYRRKLTDLKSGIKQLSEEPK